jgi:hypothetical protein|tara:strand:+ start:200 stop:424 length:225 start_codon:yes stop_codon:yes gene_type:complete
MEVMVSTEKNREEIIASICEGTVDNLCNLLEEHKIKDVVPTIDQSIDDLADCIIEVSDNLPKIKLYDIWEKDDE